VEADQNHFKLVYQSKYGKVCIFKILSVSKESKEWVADPANGIYDVEGRWFCRGQYPPVLQKVLAEKKDFKQLEDFNAKHAKDDSEYQWKYHKNLQ
jgi:dolichyl-diphosphooligosaccharide--protein glycosyltransferase